MTENVIENVENDKALVPLFRGEADAVHPLARFGESRVVRALADRIVMTDRRKTPLNKSEAILTAQAAVAYRLDPFMGELWSWVQVFQGRRVLTIMRGRDGTLKIAKQNAKEAGTYLLSPRFELILDEAKRDQLGIPDGAMAVMCYQEDKASVDDWYQRVQTLKDAKFTPTKIEATVGDIPCDTGLGILTAQEMEQLDRSGNKMTHLERVQKRAHMAALRKRFAAQEFGDSGEAASIDTDDYIIEGEWLDVVDVTPDERPQEVRESEGARASEALYGEPKAGPDRKSPSYWPKAVLEALIEKKYAENDFGAAGMLSYSTFDKTVAKTPALLFGKAYRGARDEGKEPKEAAAEGMAAYLKTLKSTKK